MGKSDPYIFQHYIKAITSYHSHLDFESVCLLGQPADNGFTQYINAKQKDFFDVSVGNWNINHFPYRSKKQYDLVICTRCPYFCIDPLAFLRECNSLLRPGGKLFVDWGLGDHLRFEKFRVGFRDEQFHEYGYSEDNLLHSCLWHPSFTAHPEVMLFSDRIRKFGYTDLNKAVDQEVPQVFNPADASIIFDNIKVDFAALWEDQPQLYIILQGEKRGR